MLDKPHKGVNEPNLVEENRGKRVALQLSVFLLTAVNYAVLHATRSSWSLATKDFEDLYGFSTGAVANLNATFLFFYSAGGLFLSTLGDRYNKKKLICFMYTLIALVEVALGLL